MSGMGRHTPLTNACHISNLTQRLNNYKREAMGQMSYVIRRLTDGLATLGARVVCSEDANQSAGRVQQDLTARLELLEAQVAGLIPHPISLLPSADSEKESADETILKHKLEAPSCVSLLPLFAGAPEDRSVARGSKSAPTRYRRLRVNTAIPTSALDSTISVDRSKGIIMNERVLGR